ncbi:unnamed protein product [Coccothraustes coccothraustes]
MGNLSSRKKEAINTVIPCWVGNSMKTMDIGFLSAGARHCVDGGEAVVLRSPFLSHCLNYNHACSCQQRQMSRNSDMEGFGHAACQD